MRRFLLLALTAGLSIPSAVISGDLPEFTTEQKELVKRECLSSFQKEFNNPAGAENLISRGVEDMDKARKLCECMDQRASPNNDPAEDRSICFKKLGVILPSKEEMEDFAKSKKGQELLKVGTKKCISHMNEYLPDFSSAAPKYCKCVGVVSLGSGSRKDVDQKCKKYLKRNK